MADTIRTLSALQTLLPDNTAHDISPQDVRDFLISTRGVWTSSAPTSINGWAATPTASGYYYRSGNILIYVFDVTGTSNDVNAFFALPSDVVGTGSLYVLGFADGVDNGTFVTDPCRVLGSIGVGINVYKGWANSNNWTASGTKTVHGILVYICAD